MAHPDDVTKPGQQALLFRGWPFLLHTLEIFLHISKTYQVMFSSLSDHHKPILEPSNGIATDVECTRYRKILLEHIRGEDPDRCLVEP